MSSQIGQAAWWLLLPFAIKREKEEEEEEEEEMADAIFRRRVTLISLSSSGWTGGSPWIVLGLEDVLK